jgi:hypothetical protein
MPANFSGALLKQPSGRGNKARAIGRTPITPNQPPLLSCPPSPPCDAFPSQPGGRGLHSRIYRSITSTSTTTSTIGRARKNSIQSFPSPCPPFPPCPPVRCLSLQPGGRGPYFRQSPTLSSLALLCWGWDAEQRANAAVRRPLVHRLAPIG